MSELFETTGRLVAIGLGFFISMGGLVVLKFISIVESWKLFLFGLSLLLAGLALIAKAGEII